MRHVSTGRFGQTMLVKGGGRLFVMKTIDVSRLAVGQREELLREVSEHALLRHPHLEIMRECFFEGGSLCIVTEYVEGGNLAGIIDKARSAGGGLPDMRVMQWFAQASLALKYVHEQGTLHRDIRAKRLLVTPELHLVLSGTATSALLANSLAPERPELEAMRYLAPELLAGDCTHTRQSDIWALGVVLFELLALRPPFEHSHPWLLAEQIRRRPLPPLPPERPPELQRLCGEMLRREASGRPSAARVLQDAAVQHQLWLLLCEDAGPLPELRAAGGGRAAPPGGARPAPGTPAQARPLGKQGATSICGPMVLSAPLATPRGLQKVGERCLRKAAGEMKAPPAVWKRSGKPPDSAGTLGISANLSDRLALTSSGPLPSTPNVAHGEVVTELMEDVSLAATNLLESSGNIASLLSSYQLLPES